jgi:plastocyanin
MRRSSDGQGTRTPIVAGLRGLPGFRHDPRVKSSLMIAMLAAMCAVVMACSSATATPSPIPVDPGGLPASKAPVDPGGLPPTQAVIVAKNLSFAPTAVVLAPAVPVRIVLQNEDSGTGHSIHVRGSGLDTKTDIVTGPATANLDLGPLQPGTYAFVCDVHSSMTGTITVPAP